MSYFSHSDHRFDPELVQELIRDLVRIYDECGLSVEYTDKFGVRRAYWPNRRQGDVQRAIADHRVVAFVEDRMMSKQPSRDFHYLKKAGRLDLSVEALVADESKRYHSLWSEEAVRRASDRLMLHDPDRVLVLLASLVSEDEESPSLNESEEAVVLLEPLVELPNAEPEAAPLLNLAPGKSFGVRITVGEHGELTLALV